MTFRFLRGARCAVAVAAVGVGVSGFAASASGAPRPEVPSRGDALVELGRRLFFDPAVSRSGENSCSSCHEPDHGFSSASRVHDDDFLRTQRHSQSLLDLAGGRSFHWDGEFDSIAELVFARLGEPSGRPGQFSRPTGAGGGGYGSSRANPTDPRPDFPEPPKTPSDPASPPAPGATTTPSDPASPPGGASSSSPSGPRGAAGANPARPAPGAPDTAGPTPLVGRFTRPGRDVGGIGLVAKRVEADGRYAEAFRAAYGTPSVSTARIADAITAYVDSIRSTTSTYDRFASGETSALDASARRGLSLFRGRAGCAQCHLLSAGHGPLTDREFHNTGVALRAADAAPTAAEIAERRSRLDRGRAFGTTDSRHVGQFKTPTLRDVALRPPYMHDGSFSTLEAVVRFYAKGAYANENLDPRIRPFDASNEDVADLVAFLRSLTGEERPGRAPEYAARTERTTLRVLDAAGHPLAGLALSLAPAGDRLPGAPFEVGASEEAVTDAKGEVSFAPSRRTHVLATLPDGLRAPQGGWIPDTCRSLEWRLPVAGRTSLLVAWPAGSIVPSRLGGDRPARTFPDFVERVLLATADRLFFASRTRVATYELVGTTDVAGRSYARYRAWVAPDAPAAVSIVFATSAGRFEREIAFLPERESRVDLTAGTTSR